MKFGTSSVVRSIAAKSTLALCALLSAVTISSQAMAQFNFGFGNRVGVVGGVSIDANGVVRDATVAEQEATLKALREQFRGAPKEFDKAVALRMVSLKGLQMEIARSRSEGKPLSEDVLFLGGLTKIEYVFLYPEQNDIVIAGPAENWIATKDGAVVGQTSGRPVLYLDDLLTAFRYVGEARNEGVSVSIDPTPEGSKRLEILMKQLGRNIDPTRADAAIREAFGPQQVRLTGVPADSHMARVLLAADYQMKRYGMDLAQAPVKGLPSYLEMIRNTSSIPQSRWWMACDYSAIEKTRDELAWKIRGKGIKTLTEQEFVDGQGNRKQSGKSDARAQKWADLFTSKIDELSSKEPVFGELRNVMDLCILAALVESKGLLEKSHCQLDVIRGSSESVELAKLGIPKSLPAQSSFVKATGGWIMSVSGGVMVDGWAVVEQTKENEELTSLRPVSPNPSHWYWN